MDSNSEEELRKELKAERDMSRRRCELPGAMARKKYNRKRAVIVFFGGVGLVFLLLLL